jgi:hypothetical protein
VFGYVRSDYGYGVHTNVPQYAGDAGARDRNSSRHPFTMRHRLNWQADARTQTAYGTLRAFTSLHVENRHTTGANDVGDVNVTTHRAFIQWAGFTFGHISSYADVPGQLGDSGIRSLHQAQTESTTGANGINQIAYTWQLGNGIRLNIGADERRVRNIGNLTTPGVRIGGQVTNTRTGQRAPSPFLSLHVNQAWGSAGIAVVAQQNSVAYYTGGPGCPVFAQVGTTDCSHPDDEWGWGVRAGTEIKLPMFGPGDRFLLSGYYSEGALRLVAQNLSSASLFGPNRTVAFGYISDGVFVNTNGAGGPGQIQQTTAWSINGGYEHYWTPNFSTAWYGGYVEVSYNDTVINSRLFCSAGQVQTVNPVRACDPGFALYHIGSVTNWFPARGFRLALDVLYTGIETAMPGQITVGSARGLRPTGAYTAKDRGVTSVMFRAQRSWGGGD